MAVSLLLAVCAFAVAVGSGAAGADALPNSGSYELSPRIGFERVDDLGNSVSAEVFNLVFPASQTQRNGAHPGIIRRNTHHHHTAPKIVERVAKQGLERQAVNPLR